MCALECIGADITRPKITAATTNNGGNDNICGATKKNQMITLNKSNNNEHNGEANSVGILLIIDV